MMWLAGAGVFISLAGGPAAERLGEFSQQTGLQMVFDYEAALEVMTSPVQGEFDSATDALEAMLVGTPLTYELLDGNTIAIQFPKYERTPGGYTQDGYHYACTPLAFFSGFYLTRLGNLLFRMGELPADLQHCVRDGRITKRDPYVPDASATDVTVRAGPRR